MRLTMTIAAAVALSYRRPWLGSTPAGTGNTSAGLINISPSISTGNIGVLNGLSVLNGCPILSGNNGSGILNGLAVSVSGILWQRLFQTLSGGNNPVQAEEVIIVSHPAASAG